MKINFDVPPNAKKGYFIDGPAILEYGGSDDLTGAIRYVYNVHVRSTFSILKGLVVKTLLVGTADRVIEYRLPPGKNVEVSNDGTEVTFMSGGRQYKIRELEEKDKSRLVYV